MSGSAPANDDATARFLEELQETIRPKFPEATFDIRVGPDGRFYLTVYTESPNDFEIQDLVVERTVDATLERDLKVHVLPRRRRA
ncbi:MAG: hypothetical protein GEU73_09160 [Chloroflexi bacterium]|nr:hypothetical protein [Chloroflexota bacterium]